MHMDSPRPEMASKVTLDKGNSLYADPMLRALARLKSYAVLCAVLILMGCLVSAQKETAHRIQFAKGQSSKKIEGAVVRGTRDRYLLGARAGQVLTVNISSVERNAVFSIAKPDGQFLPNVTDESDAIHWSGKLPATGDFVIEVGGTRGNAKYLLSVSIK